MNMRSRLTVLGRGDEGLGMVLVLGLAGVLSTLMLVSGTVALRSVASSRVHNNFESALAVADGGVDAALAKSVAAYMSTGSDSYATPSGSSVCTGSAVPWPFTSAPSASAERDWARSQLLALVGVPGCLRSGPAGNYVILKPTGHQAVYSLGWSPRYGAPEAKSRLLKAEYLFAPYAPHQAILTGGDLSINSSTTVTTAPGSDPTLATVHTNGNLTVANGNPTVTGLVTQSGTGSFASSNKFTANAGGTVTSSPKVSIPFPGARAVWYRNRLTNPPGGWYDLCPDGSARRPDGLDPCTGSVYVTLSSGSSFRGWTYTPPTGAGAPATWAATTALKQNGYSGTYYISQGDVVNPASNAGSAVPNLTVLASSVGPSGTCNKVGGNISWGSTDVVAPSLPSTWLIADQDLVTSSNYRAGSVSGGTVISGFFIAGDQISMQTSSNGAYGAVIAMDQCNPATGSLASFDEVKNPSIYYDPNAQAPFTDVVNNTLWLEYTG